jgi:hypothetical protein
LWIGGAVRRAQKSFRKTNAKNKTAAPEGRPGAKHFLEISVCARHFTENYKSCQVSETPLAAHNLWDDRASGEHRLHDRDLTAAGG